MFFKDLAGGESKNPETSINRVTPRKVEFSALALRPASRKTMVL